MLISHIDVFNLQGRWEEWALAQSLFAQIEKMYESYERVEPTPQMGTLLSELNNSYNDGAFPSNHLYVSVHCFIENLMLLQNMMKKSYAGNCSYSPYSVAPLARSALVAACRVIFVLLGNDIATNMDKIHVNNADGWHRFTKAAAEFSTLESLKYPSEVPLKISGREKISETKMCEEAFTYIMKEVSSRYPQMAQSKTLDEMLVWIWQSWSGYTHSLSWPINLPSSSSELGVTRMPGDWIADFRTLVSVCSIALDSYLKALKAT